MNMLKRFTQLTRATLGGLTAGAILLSGAMIAPDAMAGIANTKHNLGSTGTGPNTFSGSAELCVFCHTPHGSDTSAAVPLWNRKLSAPGSYTTYDSLGTSTLDGGTAPVGSVSIACLSCHDGTQAMNVMLNAPGSGNYNPAGFTLPGTWTGPASGASPVGSLNYATASIVNIGTDLRNDHPVGIEYGGGGLFAATQGGAASGTMVDPDFNAPANTLAGSTRVWYVDTGTTGRQKTDLALYTRGPTDHNLSGGNFRPFVECASCHDPHVENVGGNNPTFLRTSNAGSALCLACHDK